MRSAIELGLGLFLLWLTSVAVAFGLTKFSIALRRPRTPEFLQNASWRIRTERGAMRVRFLATTAKGYEVSAPLSQDAHVALRPGDQVYVEAPGPGVAILFRTHVIGRNLETHTFLLQPAEETRVQNRRDEARLPSEADNFVRVNGELSQLLNLSPGGAKLRTQASVSAGDWVTVDLPDQAPQYACVLEVLPDTLNGRPASGVRLMFTDPR